MSDGTPSNTIGETKEEMNRETTDQLIEDIRKNSPIISMQLVY